MIAWVALEHRGHLEVDAPEYERGGVLDWDVDPDGLFTNIGPVTFPTPLVAWGKISEFSLYADDDTLLARGTLDAPLRVKALAPVAFPTGKVRLRVTPK